MLEDDIEGHVTDSGRAGDPWIDGGMLSVLKHLAARHLERTLANRQLYASSEKGFTWGDAVYVTPLSQPLSAMMYGDVAVGGFVAAGGLRYYDATCARGLQLYQAWIAGQGPAYDLLTTTVHSEFANRELRNKFRTRFQIDCVLFRPDEPCAHYTGAGDVWLALTHWGPSRQAASGCTSVVHSLKWCLVSADVFERDGLGFKPHLFPSLTAGKHFVHAAYANLATAVLNGYQAGQVIIAGF